MLPSAVCLPEGTWDKRHLGIDPDFELVLAIAEIHDLVEGHLRGISLISLPDQFLQLLLLLLSRSQLPREVAVLMSL